NAALNDVTNIEVAEGDLFEPAAGRTFDLIVSNPPFVISPRREGGRYLFCDSGMDGDEICRRVVREAPRFLNEGGYCQLLCNWAHLSGQDWKDRLASWFQGSGCDAWVICCETRDAASYASTWLQQTEKPASGEPGRLMELFDQWMDYYRQRGIEAVSAGAITMRRVPAGRASPPWLRF